MSRSVIIHALIAALVGIVLCVQSVSLAHATSYTDKTHDHDGAVCVLNILTQDDHVVMPTVLFEPSPLLSVIATHYSAPLTTTRFDTPDNRGPPPRAPPLSFIE